MADDQATVFEQLGAADVLTVPLMEQLWKLECSGEASYLAMAELVADPRAKELLVRNGREDWFGQSFSEQAHTTRDRLQRHPAAFKFTRLVVRKRHCAFGCEG